MIDVKSKVSIPSLDQMLQDGRIEDAARDAARSRMRRKGLKRGENMDGVPRAATEAAAEEIDRQIRRTK